MCLNPHHCSRPEPPASPGPDCCHGFVSLCLLSCKVQVSSPLTSFYVFDIFRFFEYQRLGMPLMIMNLGGEMMYILEQRLIAQSIPQEKAEKVIADIVRTMYNSKFLQELFKPQVRCRLRNELCSSNRRFFSPESSSSYPGIVFDISDTADF
jgi:hypothetical protein